MEEDISKMIKKRYKRESERESEAESGYVCACEWGYKSHSD